MKYLLSLAALAATCSGLAQGSSEAILGYANSISGYADTTVGWTFHTTNTFGVTDLGCFAKVFDDNPEVTSVQVGFWDDSGVLLASNSITPASRLFGQTRYEPVTPVLLDPGTYHLGVYYSGGGIGLDVAASSTGGSVFASPAIQVDGIAFATNGGFEYPPEVAGTAGSIYAGPNFRFQLEPTSPPAVTNLFHGMPYTNSLPAYSVEYFVVQVPRWASRATNVLEFANRFFTTNPLPVTVLFNQTNFPTLADPALIGPLVSTGTAILQTNGAPPLVPGQPYYLALTNPNPFAVTFGLGVWFDITTLTQCDLLVSNVVGAAGIPRYFQFDVPTYGTDTPQPVSFWLSGAPCGLQVVLSDHLPLPDLTNFDFISQGPCTNDQILMFVTNSIPATRWYVGVFNTSATNATFSIQACATPPYPVIIPLTNGVPFVVSSTTDTNAAPPGPPQQFFFDFLITNSVAGVLFELYNLSGNADLVLQRDVPPTPPPYFYTNFFTGTTPEQIVLRTNSGVPASAYVPDLRGHWYLGVFNNEQANVAYTIRGVMSGTNGLLLPGEPLLVSITPPAPPHGLLLSWNSVVGEPYIVESTRSLVAPATWTKLATIVATAQLTTFEVLPVPTGSAFYRVVHGFPSEPPKLSIQRWTSNQIRLSWSTLFPGYTLQSKNGLSGSGSWGGAGLTVTTIGNEFVAFDLIGSGPKYYRLIR
jgi:hypothetical protein